MPDELPRVTPEPGKLRLVEKPKDHGLPGLADEGWRIVHRHAHSFDGGKFIVLTCVSQLGVELAPPERAENAKQCAAVGNAALMFSREWREGEHGLRILVLRG